MAHLLPNIQPSDAAATITTSLSRAQAPRGSLSQTPMEAQIDPDEASQQAEGGPGKGWPRPLHSSHLILSLLGRLYALFTELKTEAGGEEVFVQGLLASKWKSQPDSKLSSVHDFKKVDKKVEMERETDRQ